MLAVRWRDPVYKQARFNQQMSTSGNGKVFQNFYGTNSQDIQLVTAIQISWKNLWSVPRSVLPGKETVISIFAKFTIGKTSQF